MKSVPLCATVCVLSLLTACHPDKIDHADSKSDPMTGDDDDDDDDAGPPLARAVDVLLVVDNSGSMGRSAARVAALAPLVVDSLRKANVSVRVGVTTTDVGNPVCSATTPENGRLAVRSCADRLDDFVFDPEGPNEHNVQAVGCTDFCSHLAISTRPTTTVEDPEPKSRPWIEIYPDGTSNVYSSSSTTDVAGMLSCVVPQGISGCGFESPLEAMHVALARAADPKASEAGFRRQDALLVALVVSDEFDCSARPEAASVFTDETSPLWHPDAAGRPFSSICWRAQAKCTGSGPVYDSCEPTNYSLAAEPDVSDADAVLFPLSRYWADLDPNRSIFFGILGVPPGYGAGGPPLVYRAGDDHEQLAYGVAPGCSEQLEGDDYLTEAAPPLRMRALAESTSSGRSLFSICETDNTDPLQSMAEQILARLPPA